MPLTLVHPAREGEGPPKRRRPGLPAPSLSLTPDEARHLRASIRNLARARYGSLVKLGAALGINEATFRRKGSPALAVAIWRVTGVPVEELLRGKLAAVPSVAPAPGKDGAS
jgi:hypothetical protein